MTIEELATRLEAMVYSGETKNAMIQLFAIMYHDEISECLKREGVSKAMIFKVLKEKVFPGTTYDTELKKGYNLAKYLIVKEEYKNRWKLIKSDKSSFPHVFGHVF